MFLFNFFSYPSGNPLLNSSFTSLAAIRVVISPIPFLSSIFSLILSFFFFHSFPIYPLLPLLLHYPIQYPVYYFQKYYCLSFHFLLLKLFQYPSISYVVHISFLSSVIFPCSIYLTHQFPHLFPFQYTFVFAINFPF